MRNMRILLASGAMLLLTAWPGQAQWVTQTLSLKPGWNAVNLFVDPLVGLSLIHISEPTRPY